MWLFTRQAKHKLLSKSALKYHAWWIFWHIWWQTSIVCTWLGNQEFSLCYKEGYICTILYTTWPYIWLCPSQKYLQSVFLGYMWHSAALYRAVQSVTPHRLSLQSTHTLLHILSAPPASPPAPSRPVILRIGSTWVTLGWSEPLCAGGHRIVSFTIRYNKQTSSSFNRVYR